jgi:hypothetical protein
MLRYLVLGAIFYVLTPGILLSLPQGGSKKMTALTHAIVFVALYYLIEKLAEMLKIKKKEGKKPLKEKFYDDDEYDDDDYEDDDEDYYDEEGFQNSSYSTVEYKLAKQAYNKAAYSCYTVKMQKDEEYRRSGDSSAAFRALDEKQGQECDKMNNAANKLHDMGFQTTSLW